MHQLFCPPYGAHLWNTPFASGIRQERCDLHAVFRTDILCGASASPIPNRMCAIGQLRHRTPTLPNVVRKIATAMADLCEFMAIECDRHRRDEDGRCVRQLSQETFTPRKQATHRQKKGTCIRKRQRDRKRLSAMPPVHVIKGAVKQAMVDLSLIASHYRDKDTLPPCLSSACTAIMIGVLYLNGFAGRSKEWQEMLRQRVAEAVAAGGDFVYVSTEDTEHKTVNTYGDLGRYLAPGTVAAINEYFDLPKTSDRFLEPGPRSKNGNASVHTSLRRFCEVYLPGHAPPNTNLLRKWFPSSVQHDLAKTKKFMARLNGQSLEMLEQTYLITSPEEDARIGQVFVEVMLDGPVGPIAPEDTAASCIKGVLDRFGIALGSHEGPEVAESPPLKQARPSFADLPASPVHLPPPTSSSASSSSSSSSSSDSD